MNTSTHRNISTANFNIFALFFMLTVFSFNISFAQDCNWGPPTSLNIVNVGTTFASLTWQHPVQGPAPGGYEISVIRVSNGNKVTYNVNDTAYIVNNLSPGIQYLIEISPICANGLVSPNFISKIVIAVVINDLVYPICPIPDSTAIVFGNIIPETILTGNSSSPSASITLTWPDFSPGTNRQIYYIEVGKVNTEGYKEKFVIVRDQGSSTFYYKHIGGYNQWKSKLTLQQVVKVFKEDNKNVAICGASMSGFTISKTNHISQLKIKADLSFSCDINNPGPQPLIELDNADQVDATNYEFIDVDTKFKNFLITVKSSYVEIVSNDELDLPNTVLIYDMSGKLIFAKKYYQNNEAFNININHFPTGLYFISVFNDISFSQLKFVKS